MAWRKICMDQWPWKFVRIGAPQKGPEKRCRAKIVEKCRKTFWHFLTIFDVSCPARKLSKKSVEKLFDTFWRFLTFLDVAPFRRPLLQSADRSPPWDWYWGPRMALPSGLYLWHESSTKIAPWDLFLYTPVGTYCEINSVNILFCNWNGIFKKKHSQTIFPCNSLNPKRIRDI